MKRTVFVLAILLMISLAWTACSSDDKEQTPLPSEPRLNTSDSLALVSIYQKIGPWKQPWDFNDITTWNGVQTALDKSTNEIRVVGFEVYHGDFRGVFPKEFCQLTELRRLVVTGGTIGGIIPEDIGKLKNLIYLCVADNNLSGTIPESIGELTELQQLDFRNTKLAGTIPESIGNLVNMVELYIFGTNVSGNIPKGIANMKHLKTAALFNNRLSGRFPVEILKDDIFIICEDNDITELPFEIWNDSLACVPPILKRNRLSGEIPEWVKKTKKWNRYASVCISTQQDGYGYSNYSTSDNY
jgi:hypothetical protein